VIAYPASFPCVSRVEGHSAQIASGVVRTPMSSGVSRQRRSFRQLPQQIALAFVIDQSTYAAWLSWVNAHAWEDWVVLSLPGLLASTAGTPTAATAVRFMTDLQAELLNVRKLWVWRVRVSAEYVPLPTDYATFPGVWIIGATPGAPAPAYIIGGTPDALAPDMTQPGRPGLPTVIL
jgi:hypothetical protein